VCVRCDAFETPGLVATDEELCPYCAALTRIEAQRGMVQIESYLAKWAAFERWSRSTARDG
jgi:RNA polymerase subunit RPABC4/transcription elongation factor Spt4